MGWKLNEKRTGAIITVLGLVGLLGSYLHGQPPQEALSLHQNQPDETVSAAQRESALALVEPAATAGRKACTVLTVYDGDTLGCDLNEDGRIEKPQEEVRLLGMDSPEMHYSRKNPTYRSEHPTDEPFAPEASHWLNAQARGKTVFLEFDARRTDKYGRSLAFVYLTARAKTSLNEQAVRQGLATLLFLGRNRLHEVAFQLAESRARQEKRGLWGL